MSTPEQRQRRRWFAAFLIGVVMFMAGWYKGAGDTERLQTALVRALQAEQDALQKLVDVQRQQLQEQHGRIKCERERTQELLEHQAWMQDQTEWMRALRMGINDAT